MDSIDYKKLYDDEKKKTDLLENRLSSMLINGKAKLYYSLNRNMSEIADVLDETKVKDIDLNDPKDKTMERLKIIWSSISPLVETIRTLGMDSGVTGNEKDDTAKKPFVETIADNRK